MVDGTSVVADHFISHPSAFHAHWLCPATTRLQHPTYHFKPDFLKYHTMPYMYNWHLGQYYIRGFFFIFFFFTKTDAGSCFITNILSEFLQIDTGLFYKNCFCFLKGEFLNQCECMRNKYLTLVDLKSFNLLQLRKTLLFAIESNQNNQMSNYKC